MEKQKLPDGWDKDGVSALLAEYCERETVRIAANFGGYYARSLSDALALDSDLRRLKESAGLSISALIDALIDAQRTINAGDVRDVLAVGRAVRVGLSLKSKDLPIGYDLVKGQVSLSSARYIGSKLPSLEEKKDSKSIRKLFSAAMKGSDVRNVLPKAERKAKGDKAEGEGQSGNVTETETATRPATADELATAVMARVAEISEPVKVALLKAISASIKASKASKTAVEPAATTEKAIA